MTLSPPIPEEIFAVPVADRWLLYAPLHRVAAVVNRAALAHLVSAAAPLSGNECAGWWRLLAEYPADLPARRTGPPDPQFLGLITTRACNLSCRYCGFGAQQHPSPAMPLATAVAAVDWMANHATRVGRPTLDIHFFGGEPMMAPEVVEVAVHRARALAAERRLTARFEIATNGVCGPRLADFLGTYMDRVVLSLDGPRDIHDRHRPRDPHRGSFAAVSRTAQRLREAECALCLRACVTADTAPRLAQIARWLCDRYRPAAIDFEPLQPTAPAGDADLAPPDPYVFATSFLEAQRVAADHGVRCVYSAALLAEPRLSFCPVGNDTLIVAPDGSIRGCYLREREWQARGLDLRLGWVGADGTLTLEPSAIERLRGSAVAQPRCARCFCRWSCAGGCHVNRAAPEAAVGGDSFCIQTRLISAAQLLDQLGQTGIAKQLLGDRAAARALAVRPADRLRDWSAVAGSMANG